MPLTTINYRYSYHFLPHRLWHFHLLKRAKLRLVGPGAGCPWFDDLPALRPKKRAPSDAGDDAEEVVVTMGKLWKSRFIDGGDASVSRVDLSILSSISSPFHCHKAMFSTNSFQPKNTGEIIIRKPKFHLKTRVRR